MVWHLLFWYFTLVILGWLTFPLTFRLFRRMTDKGFTLSRILGLLLWGFFFWILTSLGLLRNTASGTLFALLILIGLSVWTGWHERQNLFVWIRSNWRLVVLAEVVFFVGFAFMTLVRASDPFATGTEKPMELAFINAIIKSKTFPPHDPWLSGYAISYYHFGYILAALLAKLTATTGGVAFNLMLASVFGLSALGAYGILLNLLSLSGNFINKAKEYLVWSLMAPVFLLFVSNLEIVLEILHQSNVGYSDSGEPSRFWLWLKIEEFLTPPSNPISLKPQRFWWWWQASRTIQDIDLVGNVSTLSPIDEFPAFSFVLGDLHPHVLVMPFVMLLVGLALNIFKGGLTGKKDVFGFHLPYKMDLFLVSAITLGGIAFLNTWDLPVYFALLTLAFLISKVLESGWAWERLYDFLVLAVPLAIVSLVFYLPFFISFQSQAGGLLPNLVYPTRGIYLWLMFGTLLLPLFLFFGWLIRRKTQAKWNIGFGITLSILVFLLLLSLRLGYSLAQTEGGASLIASQNRTGFWDLLMGAFSHRLAYGVGLLTLLILLVLALGFLFGRFPSRGWKEPCTSLPFILLMIFLGGVMVLVPEFVYLRDNFGSRMNTVFKFYYQAWMLWSLSAAYAAVVLFKKGSVPTKILTIGIILAGLAYPLFAFPEKTEHFQPANGYTLDAGGYLDTYQENEAAAIKWVSQAPVGVVAEAIGGQYSGYARVSTLSGQSTVLGWPGHEGQWRGGYEEVGSRESDIRTLYETPNWDTALEIIQRYDIRYIYVGGLEWNTYAVNPEKFYQNLKIEFDQGGVQVFVVPQLIKE